MLRNLIRVPGDFPACVDFAYACSSPVTASGRGGVVNGRE